MHRLLKHELFFLVAAAAVLGGYLYLGVQIAPEVPPESTSGGVFTMQQFTEQMQQRTDAIAQREEFLRQWNQWGAGVGIVLIAVYTWWLPPWREPAEKSAKKKPQKLQSHRVKGPVSRKALLMMLATLVLLIIAVAVVVALVR